MTDRQFYAYVEIEEYGQPSREQRIGPFYADDEDSLRATLEEVREQPVNRIEPVEG